MSRVNEDRYRQAERALWEAVGARPIERRLSLERTDATVRVQEVGEGEPVVFVATAARHRRGAFEACDFLMDYLKSKAPFWKKEHGPDGARWVEPRAEDHDDLARWEKETSK